MSVYTDSIESMNSSDSNSRAYSSCEDSNVETFTHLKNRLETSKEYWFGKKFFEFVLAERVLEHSQNTYSVNHLDAQLQMAINLYPFKEHLQQLHQATGRTLQSGSSPQKTYHAFMTLVGGIIHHGIATDKGSLRASIHDYQRSTEPAEEASESSYASFARQRYARSWSTLGFSRSPEIVPPAVSRYTSVLKEYGDTVDKTAIYKISQITSDPPLFKSIVQFDGCVFEGRGRTKRQAKHEASKDACQYLKIESM